MPLHASKITTAALLGLLPILPAAPLEISTATGLHGATLAGCWLDWGACEHQDLQLSLLQSSARPSGSWAKAGKGAWAKVAPGQAAGQRDLVLVHIPYHFGRTIENVAMFGSGPASSFKAGMYLLCPGKSVKQTPLWGDAWRLARPDGEIWGFLNPDLQLTNNVTGCPMYYTPPKYWPEDLAVKYFGNKMTFGLLRDPYERLVALFRGHIFGNGARYLEFFNTCDINTAVKQMLKEEVPHNKFAHGCSLLPQAEFFEGRFGINLPIDSRLFPQSMNEAFEEHGYPDFKIEAWDTLHPVNMLGCPNVWAADLDAETRALVREVYAEDFELLCEHFGYCDREENCCIHQVPLMCPPQVMANGYGGQLLNFTA